MTFRMIGAVRMDRVSRKPLAEKEYLEEHLREILFHDERVLFAYLYGSFTEEGPYQDIDMAVYAMPEAQSFSLPSDLKVALAEQTRISPDIFDIRAINELLTHGDLFALCYLQRVFEKKLVLVDKDVEARTDFLEQYNLKYRECKGLLDEVLL